MVLRGIVTAAGRAKTCTVKITRTEVHPIYKKALQRIQHYAVHDEANLAGAGDTVTIRPAGRRISKNKSYILASVDEKAHVRKTELPEASSTSTEARRAAVA